jgi:S1-C subfamily serine protease
MRIRLALCAGVVVAAVATAQAAAGPQAVHLTRAVIRLKDGEVWGHWGNALTCGIAIEELKWRADRDAIDPHRLSQVFDEELSSAGLKAAKSESLFDEAPTGGLQLGIVINHIDAQICSASVDGGPATRTYRGKMSMSAEWQVFDPVKAEVVARIQTSAAGEQPNRTRDGVERLMIAAFRANAVRLVADPAFQRATSGEIVAGPQPIRTSLQFSPSRASGRPLSASLSSVATILTADAWGSGFLISNDGYMLTNHHVVGDAAQVRVRWSDKSESVAQVLRSDRRRDVALLKVDANGRMALPLRAGAPSPGEPVVAIGTPLDKEFQNTVTKGVVSGNRVVEGQSFVQSDVAVDHGNSGGPLLDENGQVVAITDWGYAPDGVSHNLNFFIPIEDALKTLALTQVATSEPPPAPAAPAVRSARKSR